MLIRPLIRVPIRPLILSLIRTLVGGVIIGRLRLPVTCYVSRLVCCALCR